MCHALTWLNFITPSFGGGETHHTGTVDIVKGDNGIKIVEIDRFWRRAPAGVGPLLLGI